MLVRDEEGGPAAGVTVAFAVTAGAGGLSLQSGAGTGDDQKETLEVRTDPTGVALVAWQLGPRPGANRAEARLDGASGSPVLFVARGDSASGLPDPGDQGGGCSCRTPRHPAHGPGWGALLLVLSLGLAWRRRRRCYRSWRITSALP